MWAVPGCVVHISGDTEKDGFLVSSKDDKGEIWRVLFSLRLDTFVLEREFRSDAGSQCASTCVCVRVYIYMWLNVCVHINMVVYIYIGDFIYK